MSKKKMIKTYIIFSHLLIMSTFESTDMSIDNLCDNMNEIYVTENNQNIRDLITFIRISTIDDQIKNTVENLIRNDNYQSYVDIYNICVENNIELPSF